MSWFKEKIKDYKRHKNFSDWSKFIEMLETEGFKFLDKPVREAIKVMETLREIKEEANEWR